MKLFRTVYFVVGCLCGSYIPQATAQVVRIGFPSDSPVDYVRHQYVNGNLVNYIKKLLPSHKIRWISFNRSDDGVRALKQQHIDLWLTASGDNPQWIFSDDLFQEHWGLISLSGQPHPQSLKKLSGLKLAVEDRFFEQLSEQNVLGQTLIFSSWNGGVNLLEKHLVDGVLMPHHVFKKLLTYNANIQYDQLPLWQDYRLTALKYTPGAQWINQINRHISSDNFNLTTHQSSASSPWPLVGALLACILLLLGLCLSLFRYYRLRRQLSPFPLTGKDSLKGGHQLSCDITRWLQTERSFGIFMFEFSRQIELYESYGLETGQRLLHAYAYSCREQLKKRYPHSELYCWQDRYFVLLSGKTPHSYQQMAQQIAQTCRGWVNVDNLKLRLRSHVGWTVNHKSRRTSVNAEVLIGEAYLALRQAIVRQQRNCAYLDQQRLFSRARLALEAKLRQAIDSNELTLYVQPQFSLTIPSRLVGAEVLVRWITRDGQFISPAHFIPIAEQTGLIVRLDHWVCEHSVAMLAKYQSLLPEDFRLSVNFSAVSISRGLCEKLILDSIKRWRVPPRNLCIEITESAIMNSLVATRQSIARLRQQGFDIAIDDFGTGYSSMAYLKNLAVTHLKIDQIFTAGLENGMSDQQIVKAIAMVGKSFGHHILIEGVEQAKQATLATQLGCQFVQGFHFAKPMAWIDFVRQYLGEGHLIPALKSS